jgi:hypothetical protein
VVRSKRTGNLHSTHIPHYHWHHISRSAPLAAANMPPPWTPILADMLESTTPETLPTATKLDTSASVGGKMLVCPTFQPAS